VDLTQQTCQFCRGVDLTKLTCQFCRGTDLTQLTCTFCRGAGVSAGSRCYHCSGTGKQSRCYHCSGTGRQSRCYHCSGTGHQSRCYHCSGTAKQSRCYHCSGTGKQSRCYHCSGQAASGALCRSCAGFGTVERIVTKHNTLVDLSRSVAAKKGDTTRAPPATVAAEDGSGYGEVSAETGRPKTVFVNGYSRKDGTYVKSHYRSLPNPTVAPQVDTPRLVPFVAENGSYYGQPNQYGVPKTVPVQGYFRKDGTYVRGHYRSAPRR
jgi:hypothetical protein